jgi:predicted Zn-dependent protease with MMP-like domain
MNQQDWDALVVMAEKETAQTLKNLPTDLREHAEAVPLVFEPWVSEELANEDIEPDVLGLFVGTPFDVIESTDPMPPQIFVFLESIWEAVEGDEEAFRTEVRLTYLHELGHYLGLDEEDIEARGLG